MGKLKRSFPTYRQPGVVTFGTGSVKALIESDDLTETAIFLSGQEEVRNIVVGSLQKYGHDLAEAYVMTKPAGEPTYAMVQSGAAFLGHQPWRRIVGIGGGSVLDWCRLAWAVSQDTQRFILSYCAIDVTPTPAARGQAQGHQLRV